MMATASCVDLTQALLDFIEPSLLGAIVYLLIQAFKQ